MSVMDVYLLVMLGLGFVVTVVYVIAILRRMFRAKPEVPEAVDPIEFLFEELLNLAEYVGPMEKDTIGHIRQELERYRRGQRDKPDVP